MEGNRPQIKTGETKLTESKKSMSTKEKVFGILLLLFCILALIYVTYIFFLLFSIPCCDLVLPKIEP